MKKAIVIVLALVMVFALAACGGGASKPMKEAAGTYEGTQCKFVGSTDWVKDEKFSLELKSDGTGTHNRDDMSFDVTWKIDGEDFTMTEKFAGLTIDYNGTLKNGELHIYNGDKTDDLTYEYVYAKK